MCKGHKKKDKIDLLKRSVSKSFSIIENFISKANELGEAPSLAVCDKMWDNLEAAVSPEEIYCVLFYCRSRGYLRESQNHEFILKIYELAGYYDETVFLRWMFFVEDHLIKKNDSGAKSVCGDSKLKNKLISIFTGKKYDDKKIESKNGNKKADYNDDIQISRLMNTDELLAKDVNAVFHFMENDCKVRSKRDVTILRFICDGTIKNKSCYVSRITCYFLYFYAKEAKVKMPRGNTAFFSDLFQKAGHDPGIDTLAHVEDAITYYAVKQGHFADRWKKDLMEWDKKKGTYEARLKIPKISQTGYDAWYQEVMIPGFDEKEQAEVTQRTVALIDEWKDGSKGITKEMISVILDTELRRHWYFCRLLQLIMKKRIKDDTSFQAVGLDVYRTRLDWVRKSKENNIVANQIVGTFNYAFDGSDSTAGVAFAPLNERLDIYGMLNEVRGEKKKREYENREQNSDLRPGGKEILSLVFYGYTFKETKKHAKKIEEEEISGRKVNKLPYETKNLIIEKISFENSEASVKIRNNTGYTICGVSYVSYECHDKNGTLLSKGKMYLMKDLNDDEACISKIKISADVNRLIFDTACIIKDQRKVGRNLLLLTALLAKAYDVAVDDGRAFTLEYVKENVLKNSRYDTNFNPSNRFDLYFLETFKAMDQISSFTQSKEGKLIIDEEDQLHKRIKLLQTATGKMEKHYLRKGIAILNLSLLGKM